MQGDRDSSSLPGLGAEPPSPIAPASHGNGLCERANDYLNGFSEIITLIEMLPDRPELVADIQAWRPKTYWAYFEEKADPAGRAALIAYERMEPKLRHDFEAAVAELDRLATGTLAAIRHQLKQDGAPQFADLCARAGQAMRKILKLACNIINGGAPNHGGHVPMQTRPIAARRAAPAEPSAQSPPAGSDR